MTDVTEHSTTLADIWSDLIHEAHGHDAATAVAKQAHRAAEIAVNLSTIPEELRHLACKGNLFPEGTVRGVVFGYSDRSLLRLYGMPDEPHTRVSTIDLGNEPAMYEGIAGLAEVLTKIDRVKEESNG